MPVMSLEVPRKHWNDVAMAGIRLGLDCEPDAPSDDVSTSVEVSGSLAKLQQALMMCSKGVALIALSARSERNMELDATHAFEMLENRVRRNRTGPLGSFHQKPTPKLHGDTSTRSTVWEGSNNGTHRRKGSM